MELTLACIKSVRSSDLAQQCSNGADHWLERTFLFIWKLSVTMARTKIWQKSDMMGEALIAVAIIRQLTRHEVRIAPARKLGNAYIVADKAYGKYSAFVEFFEGVGYVAYS